MKRGVGVYLRVSTDGQTTENSKTLGIGTGLVQRVLTDQTRPFDVDVVAEACACQ